MYPCKMALHLNTEPLGNKGNRWDSDIAAHSVAGHCRQAAAHRAMLLKKKNRHPRV